MKNSFYGKMKRYCSSVCMNSNNEQQESSSSSNESLLLSTKSLIGTISSSKHQIISSSINQGTLLTQNRIVIKSQVPGKMTKLVNRQQALGTPNQVVRITKVSQPPQLQSQTLTVTQPQDEASDANKTNIKRNYSKTTLEPTVVSPLLHTPVSEQSIAVTVPTPAKRVKRNSQSLGSTSSNNGTPVAGKKVGKGRQQNVSTSSEPSSLSGEGQNIMVSTSGGQRHETTMLISTESNGKNQPQMIQMSGKSLQLINSLSPNAQFVSTSGAIVSSANIKSTATTQHSSNSILINQLMNKPIADNSIQLLPSDVSCSTGGQIPSTANLLVQINSTTSAGVTGSNQKTATAIPINAHQIQLLNAAITAQQAAQQTKSTSNKLSEPNNPRTNRQFSLNDAVAMQSRLSQMLQTSNSTSHSSTPTLSNAVPLTNSVKSMKQSVSVNTSTSVNPVATPILQEITIEQKITILDNFMLIMMNSKDKLAERYPPIWGHVFEKHDQCAPVSNFVNCPLNSKWSQLSQPDLIVEIAINKNITGAPNKINVNGFTLNGGVGSNSNLNQKGFSKTKGKTDSDANCFWFAQIIKHFGKFLWCNVPITFNV